MGKFDIDRPIAELFSVEPVKIKRKKCRRYKVLNLSLVRLVAIC